MAPKSLHFQKTTKMVMTRRTIQHEFLRLLNEEWFDFRRDNNEPYGIQSRVMNAVNQQYYGPTRMKTNPQTVSDWIRRVRENDYKVTSCEQDYSQSSQNRRQFYEAEQKRMRDFIREEKLKCTEIASVYSDKKKKQIPVSKSTARRYMKIQLDGEPSHVAAKPKGHKIGGMTAHHRKCRLVEARFWNNQPQRKINGMVFADESKMRFREGRNKQIDIEWCFRGDASETNWYENPRHTTQVNLFLVQSIDGIMLWDLYDYNMTKETYEQMLPQIREQINASQRQFSYYMHDNAWRGARPTAALNQHIGRGKWTKYMGPPCKRDHETMRTPVTDKPCQVPKKRCGCDFPDGPVHAAYNPKLNLVEQTFAEIDRILLKMKREDAVKGISWLVQRTKRKTFWKRQLRKAIRRVNKDKKFFKRQYAGFKERCQKFIKSRGKRLKTTKW